jgi:N-acetylmuramoyl-L-alanine amidase
MTTNEPADSHRDHAGVRAPLPVDAAAMLTIAIDPGHGGESKGAVVPELVEADYVINFARFLALRLKHSAEPFEVHLLRERNDETVSLAERGRRSKEIGADLVVSIHVNAGPDQRQGGAMAFYWPGNEHGWEVCDAWLRAMPPPLYTARRSFAADPSLPGDEWLSRARNVLEPHECTSVLWELGYCTNKKDLDALLDPATQSAMVSACLVGLARFRQLAERSCQPAFGGV